MATKVFEGGARARKQVTTITVGGTPGAGDTYSVTLNNKTITYTFVTNDTNTTIATGLTALLDDTDNPPEFQEIDWTSSGAVITGTAKTAGKPFGPSTIADMATVSDGVNTSLTAAHTTANIGPEVWSEPTNWSGGAIPANSDDVYISDELETDILYDLDNATMAGRTLTSFNVPAGYTGKIGLPEINEDNSTLPYGEYRATYLLFNAPPTTVNIGDGEGDGSPLLKLDLGTAAADTTRTINVYQTGTPELDDLEACLLKFLRSAGGSDNANINLNVMRGSVGVAVLPGETSAFNGAGTVGSFRVGYQTSQDSDAKVRCGPGVTFHSAMTFTQTGGELRVSSNLPTTFTKKGGTTYVTGTATGATINHDKGTIFWRSNGTITALNVGSEATVDFNGDPRAKTVSACDVNHGATIIDEQGVVTWTAGIDLNRVDVVLSGEVDIRLGPHRRITPGTIA